MLIRFSGGKSGISKYLINGQKAGREYSRDELDQRVELHGSIEQLDATLDSFDLAEEHQKYFHITLSFKEKVISEEHLRDIDKQFRDFIFTACAEDEFYYYSEAHLPRLKKLPDKNGHEYDRFPHIHVVIPEYNLYTGKRDNPLSRVSAITHYINAFQEHINDEYNLESPKDNVRTLSVGRAEIINRYELTPDMSRQDIKKTIFDLVRNNPEISSVDELATALKPLGKIRVRDSKSFGAKYINLSFDDGGKRKAINLKDAVFLDEYLATRDPTVSRSFVAPEQDKLLDDWRQFGAREARFVDKASAQVRQAYFAMDKGQRQRWLDRRWEEHIGQLEELTGEPPGGSASLIPLEYQPSITLCDYDEILHLDDIGHIDDTPHFDYVTEYEDDEQWREGQYRHGEYTSTDEARTSGYDLYDVQSRSRHGGQGEGGLVAMQDILPKIARNDLARDKEAIYTDLYVLRSKGHLGAVASFGGEVTARKQLSAWTERINSIDARTLLDYLTYHYKLDSEQLSIERNKAGHDRIAADGRRYSAADFLTKKMHLSWTDSKVILEKVLQQQQIGGYRRQAVTSKLMWHRFQRYEDKLPGIATINANYRKNKTDIYKKWSFEYDHSLSSAQNTVKRRLYAQQRKAELEKATEMWQDERSYYSQKPNERYLQWLQREAEKGSIAALGELHRVYPEHQEDKKTHSVFTIEIKDRNQVLPSFAPFDLGYQVSIQKNGTVEYRNKEENTVIIDTYQSIKVHERKAETIAKALELARARFGVNGFEVRNASQADLKAIQQAVNISNVEVTVINNKERG